jgi:carbon-monoxide dehydrogenase medium subunit
MKPAAFDYVRPASVAEALSALAATPGARVLAGGQTLGPMLNLRLARPPLLVDITRIPELAAVSEDSHAVTIGATVTHAAIEDGRVPDPTGGFLARVARGIAYRAVRTRGTIGGSLAHADPSADWLACLTALGAEVAIAGPAGTRRVPLAAFVRGAMETQLAPAELLTAIRIPKFPREARFGFYKICRKAGEFADAIGVVVADPRRGCTCIAAGATLGRPLVMKIAASQSGGMTADAARAFLTAAGFGGDTFDIALHAAALKRAHHEAFAASASRHKEAVAS